MLHAPTKRSRVRRSARTGHLGLASAETAGPLVRRVNDDIRKRTEAGPAPFFCECRPACFHAVWLDVLAYDTATRLGNARLLADGHHGDDGDPPPIAA